MWLDKLTIELLKDDLEIILTDKYNICQPKQESIMHTYKNIVKEKMTQKLHLVEQGRINNVEVYPEQEEKIYIL